MPPPTTVNTAFSCSTRIGQCCNLPASTCPQGSERTAFRPPGPGKFHEYGHWRRGFCPHPMGGVKADKTVHEVYISPGHRIRARTTVRIRPQPSDSDPSESDPYRHLTRAPRMACVAISRIGAASGAPESWRPPERRRGALRQEGRGAGGTVVRGRTGRRRGADGNEPRFLESSASVPRGPRSRCTQGRARWPQKRSPPAGAGKRQAACV